MMRMEEAQLLAEEFGETVSSRSFRVAEQCGLEHDIQFYSDPASAPSLRTEPPFPASACPYAIIEGMEVNAQLV